MKKINSLARALTLPLVLLVIMITSCTKPKTDPNPPPAAPYLNVSLSRDTAWYADTVTCNFTSDGVVKLNGSSEVSNPIVSSNITSDVAYQLTATKTVNGVISPTTTRDVKIPVRTQFITDFCWNFNSGDYGKWKMIAVSVNGVPKPELVDNSGNAWVHRPNGIRHLVTPSGQSSPSFYEIRVSGSDTFVTLGLPAIAGGPPNEWKIVILNANIWSISKVADDGTKATLIYVKD